MKVKYLTRLPFKFHAGKIVVQTKIIHNIMAYNDASSVEDRLTMMNTE